MDKSEKVRENRARRAAERQGLQVVKSRRRDPRAVDYGTFGLIDPYRNVWVAYSGQEGYGMTLEEIERELDMDRSQR